MPGEGTLKLAALLKKLKAGKYNRYLSTKVEIKKADLADVDKVMSILKKIENSLQKTLKTTQKTKNNT